jgi:hypothetical protein
MIGLLDFPRVGLPEGQNYAVPEQRFGSDPELWAALNPINHVEALRGMKLLIQTGRAAFDRTMNENFVQRLHKAGIAHRFEKLDGGHTFAVVRQAVPRALQFAAKCFEEAESR